MTSEVAMWQVTFFYKETRSHQRNYGTCQTFGVIITGGATLGPDGPRPLVCKFFQCSFDSWYGTKNCRIGIGLYWALITDGLEHKL
jgi:hypothetical protein